MASAAALTTASRAVAAVPDLYPRQSGSSTAAVPSPTDNPFHPSLNQPQATAEEEEFADGEVA